MTDKIGDSTGQKDLGRFSSIMTGTAWDSIGRLAHRLALPIKIGVEMLGQGHGTRSSGVGRDGVPGTRMRMRTGMRTGMIGSRIGGRLRLQAVHGTTLGTPAAILEIDFYSPWRR